LTLGMIVTSNPTTTTSYCHCQDVNLTYDNFYFKKKMKWHVWCKNTIPISDMARILYVDALILKIIGHDTWYMHIKKYTIFLKTWEIYYCVNPN